MYKLNQINGPDAFDLETIQAYNVSDAVLSGKIYSHNPLYGDLNRSPAATDLIGLKSRVYHDFFSRWVCRQSLTILKVFGRFLPMDKVSGKPTIFDSAIMKYTHYFTAVLAAVLLAVIAYVLS